MAGISTHPMVMLIERSRLGGLDAETFTSRLELVKQIINSGNLAGCSYGDDKHKAALDEVRKQLAATECQIAKREAHERWMNELMDREIVKAALVDGRRPDDIMMLQCPKCQRWDYYNQGSHFTCDVCQVTFYCASEDETPPDDCEVLRLDVSTTLQDLFDDTWEVGP